eukprot:symbB.v1.2.015570.t1/scaffold1165.1/size134377/2
MLSDTVAVIGAASFPDLDLDLTDLGGQLTWDAPAPDVSLVTHYNIYMARYYENTGENESDSCDDGTAVDLAASISGELTMQVPADAAQVEAAVRATLLASLPGLSTEALLLRVSQVSRRLAEGRRLATTWDVSYQATMSLANVAAATSTANGFSQDVLSFAQLLKPQLLVVGVPSAVLDSGFNVMSFSRLAMDIVDSTYLAEHFSMLMAAAGNQSDTSDEVRDPDVNASRRLTSPRRMEYIASIFSVSFNWCRRFAGTMEVQTRSMTVPPETVMGNYTHYLIYAASSLAEQTYPLALLIDDTDASVSSIHFYGQDLDFYDLGGDVSWQAPNDTEHLDAYLVYLAEGATGIGRSQLGSAVPPEVLKLHVPSNTKRANFTHFTVYTRSVLVEQTTPAFLAIQDEASRANNVSFIDDDLDLGEIGGNLTWLPPVDDSEVIDYVIYLAEDRFGSNRSLLGNVTVDTYSFPVPENTQLLRHTHLLVYARSVLEEQTTPAAVVIIETVATVSNVTFVDLDLDEAELGGRVTFDGAGLSERVVSYVIYLATSFMPVAGRWKILEFTGREVMDLPPETPLKNFSYILVYSKSILAEQTTPAFFALNDSIASASGVAFFDLDLDEGDIGGALLYESTVSVTKQSLQIPAETKLTLDANGGMLTHALVYTRSALVEQSTPSSHVIVDEVASVSNISFTDLDLDPAEVGGVVSWSPPPLTFVQSVHLYLTDSVDGNGYISEVEAMAANITDLQILYDTDLENFTHLAIFTRSSLIEQTTPVALALSDTIAIVSNVSFADFDLDLTELGGPITWDGSDVPEVKSYAIYVARAARVVGPSRVCLHPLESLRATSALVADPSEYIADGTAGVTGDDVALIEGSFQISINDETLSSAVQISLANLLSIDVVNVTVSASTARRLARQLSSTMVNFKVLSSTATSSLSKLTSTSLDPAPLAAMIGHLLFALGVERAISLELSITNLQFSQVSMSSWLPAEVNETVLGLSMNVGVLSVPNDRLAICERLQVGNVSVMMENFDLPVEFPLEKWTHILVYSASSGAEQSTPFAVSIADVSSSISGLTFVDKDLDLGDLGGLVQWSAPTDIRRVEAYRIYLTESSTRSLVGSEVPVGINETFIPAETSNTWSFVEARWSFGISSTNSIFFKMDENAPWTLFVLVGVSHKKVYTRSQLVEQTTPIGLAISDTSASVSAVNFVDDDLDQGDLGGRLSWDPPSDVQQVTSYVAYFASVCQDGRPNDSVVAEVVGSLSVSLAGASQEQVTAAVKASLASSLGVSASDIIVTSITTARRLSTTWQLTYKIAVPVAQASQLVSLTTAISSDATIFLDTLRQDLIAQGVDSVSVNALQLLSFSPATVTIVVVEGSNVTDDSEGDNVNTSDGLGRRLSEPSAPAAVPLWICAAEFLGNVTVNDTSINLPAETALRNWTHLLVYTSSALAEQTTPEAHLIFDAFASVSGITFLDLDLDLGQLGGTATWLEPKTSDRLVAYDVYLAATETGSDLEIPAFCL